MGLLADRTSGMGFVRELLLYGVLGSSLRLPGPFDHFVLAPHAEG
jgi:hypothetical protein